MCGICGIVPVEHVPAPSENRRRVEAMLSSLRHRGPDDAGMREADGVIFAAARLAIRAPGDGQQPIVDNASGIMAVCSGEIDNHRELRAWLAARGRIVPQQTDVAVIPALYAELGSSFVEKLVGVFALAIWDPRHRTLALARDRAGERSLFFAQEENHWVFASEIAAIVARQRLNLTPDAKALRQYAQFGVFPSPQSPLAHVQKLGPGEMIELNAEGERHRIYWQWPNVETEKTAPSMGEFDRIFRESARKQTEVDVDFGVFLSGGVDSSLVAAVVRSLHPKVPLNAYTLRFDEDSFDEGAFARTVARRLGLNPVEVWVRPEDMREGIRSLIGQTGEPLADPAWVPTALLSRRAAQDVKISLVGEGADELFGGYPTYLGAGLAERFGRCPRWMRVLSRRCIQALPLSEKKVTLSFLLKRFVDGAEMPDLARHRLWVSNISPALLMRLGIAPITANLDLERGGSVLDRIQRWDLETSLAEGLLTKSDRGSMSSALELRAPFLDQEVMMFASRLPEKDRVHGFATKVFLKQYALSYLPREIVYRRKRGLSVPLAKWLRGPLREWAEAALASARLQTVGVQASAASALLIEHVERKADHARAIWTLITLSEWLDWVSEQNSANGKSGWIESSDTEVPCVA